MDAKTGLPLPTQAEVSTDYLGSIRQKAVLEIEKAQQKDPSFSYGASDHFITIYKDPRVYSDFGLQPPSLNAHLESALAHASQHFGIEVPPKLHAIGIGTSKFLGMQIVEKPYDYKEKAWKYALGAKSESIFGIRPQSGIIFSDIASSRKKGVGGKPAVFEDAVRIGVGEGFILPALMTEWAEDWSNLHLLRDGIGYYIHFMESGVNPHDVMRKEMVDYAMQPERFGKIGGDFRDPQSMSADKIIKLLGKREGMRGNISMARMFALRAKNDRFTYDRDGRSQLTSESAYYRGASFVKYLIDTLGIDGFKNLVAKISTGSLERDLQGKVGMSISDVERGWKNAVLQGFEENPLLDVQEAERPRMPKAPRDKIKEIYVSYC